MQQHTQVREGWREGKSDRSGLRRRSHQESDRPEERKERERNDVTEDVFLQQSDSGQELS